MGDNHPAKIAKYLLKGWCLLNEYCPNGQNVPLVRSREGQLICAGCDASCPHFATHGEASADVIAKPAPVHVVQQTKDRDVQVASAQFALPPSSVTTGARGGAAQASSPSDIVFTAPESRFNCVRLDHGSGGAPRLLGESYVAKVRVGMSSSNSVATLSSAIHGALSKACRKLDDHVLIPQSLSGVAVVRSAGQGSAGQVSVTCGDTSQFAFPDRDCVFLPGVSLDIVARWLLENLSCEDFSMGDGNVQFLEVSLSSSLGEVSCRKALSGGDAPKLATLANDW